MNGVEECPGCREEERVNERGRRAHVPFIGTSWKTRFQLLGRCWLEPGVVVPAVKSQELGKMAHEIEG